MVTNLAWGFSFLPEIDSISGSPIFPDPDDYSNVRFITSRTWESSESLIPQQTVTANPRPFKCRIMPRSEAHLRLIDENFVTSASALKVFELDLNEEDKLFNAKYRDLDVL